MIAELKIFADWMRGHLEEWRSGGCFTYIQLLKIHSHPLKMHTLITIDSV